MSAVLSRILISAIFSLRIKTHWTSIHTCTAWGVEIDRRMSFWFKFDWPGLQQARSADTVWSAWCKCDQWRQPVNFTPHMCICIGRKLEIFFVIMLLLHWEIFCIFGKTRAHFDFFLLWSSKLWLNNCCRAHTQHLFYFYISVYRTLHW